MEMCTYCSIGIVYILLLKKESTMWKLYRWKLYIAYSIKNRKYSKEIQNVGLYVYCEYLSTQKNMTSSAILNDLPWWSPASAKHWNVQCVPYGQK